MGVTVKHRRNCRGFSLIELLLVIAIVALLAALLLPAISKGYARGKRTKSLANLKQLGIGFHAFAHDHNDKFPTQVSTNSGGTLEFINNAGLDIAGAFRTFQALSNELLDPKILVCPADTRVAAADFRALKNENVSYFVAPFAEMGRSESVLAGDRNLILPSSSSSPTGVSGWTQELHEGQGNVLFADARAELVTGGGVQGLVASSKTPIVVMLPSASATSTTPAAGRGTTVAGGPPNAVNGAGIANRSGSGTAAVGGGAAGPPSSRDDGGGPRRDTFR